jgi:hypothetical protein
VRPLRRGAWLEQGRADCNCGAAFEELDEDGSGKISTTEVKAGLEQVGMVRRCRWRWVRIDVSVACRP